MKRDETDGRLDPELTRRPRMPLLVKILTAIAWLGMMLLVGWMIVRAGTDL